MGDHALYLIYWESPSAKAYLYGTQLDYLPDRSVRFCNRLMPSGYPIQEWTSFCDFQRDRHEPQLPILAEGCRYRYRACFREYPRGTVLLRFDFYDQQDVLLDTVMTEKKHGVFTAPERTFRYTMQLVQGGSETVLFRYIELFPEQAGIYYRILRKDPKAGELNILIPEPGKRMITAPDEEQYRHLQNVTAFSPGICETMTAGKSSFLRRLSGRYARVILRPEGKRSLAAARELLTQIPNGQIRRWTD
ncbi:MAG: accessory Sec system protein Asp3 [Clostridiales bacterium]|nr:accessory Sec system protein Asp3 [Clostridiales bacterium]